MSEEDKKDEIIDAIIEHLRTNTDEPINGAFVETLAKMPLKALENIRQRQEQTRLPTYTPRRQPS